MLRKSSLSSLLAVALAFVSACGGGSGGSKPESPPPDTCSNVKESAMVTDAWTSDPHYCMWRFATSIPASRGLTVMPNNDILVVANGEIRNLRDADGDGVSDQALFVSFPGSGLNHGLTRTATHVYASSQTTVYRWPFVDGQRPATGPEEIVVSGILAGGHNSRSLVIDAQNRLYVTIGSASNVDAPADPNTPPQERALIWRFDLNAIPAGGHTPATGEIFATGLRNEVGLTIDSKGRMWGVENGRDNLMVDGEDIHYDNPGEEVNLFDTNRPGRNYGYPFCWSEGIWMDPARAKGPRTQHLDPDQPGAFTEAKCQDANIVVPPAFVLGAHMAPLGIIEYQGKGYPSELAGSMFVASHGSWNREIEQVGRMIVRLKMGPNGPTEAVPFLGQSDGAGGLQQGSWMVRPVSFVVDNDGLLVFSDDTAGTINKIGYKP